MDNLHIWNFEFVFNIVVNKKHGELILYSHYVFTLDVPLVFVPLSYYSRNLSMHDVLSNMHTMSCNIQFRLEIYFVPLRTIDIALCKKKPVISKLCISN